MEDEIPQYVILAVLLILISFCVAPPNELFKLFRPPILLHRGLQLIANGAGHTLLLNGRKAVRKSVIVSSIFRLVVGYLFLASLFINIAQNSDVIEIFYDVLALEFVEK